MALVLKKKSSFLNFYDLVTAVAGENQTIGAVKFNFNKMVQVRSVTVFFPVEALMLVKFLDVNGEVLNTNPVTAVFGFEDPCSEPPGFTVKTGHQVFFESMICGGLFISDFVATGTVEANLLMQVEILQSYLGEEFDF